MARPTQSTALREEMVRVFARAKMPSSPATASQILGLIHDPDSTAEQFARVIETDPGLAARLLQMANSSAYSQRTRVSSVQRAVTIIGLRKLRIMVLGLELVSHIDRLGNCPFDLPTFWQQALVRACLAREIARHVVPLMAEEAFLVGLLQDCGMIVLVQAQGMPYAMLVQELADAPVAFHAEESHRFPYDHATAVGVLADMWKLPAPIAEPLARHHSIPVGAPITNIERLNTISALVGSLGMVRRTDDIGKSESVSRRILDTLELEDGVIESCVEAAARVYAETSPVFGDSIGDDYDATELLQEANRQLALEAAQLLDEVDDVSAERDELLSEQVSLQNALGMYREQAARDPLTGVFNRGALIDATVDLIARAEQEQTPITVMFLDIDDFKRLNDCYGHSVGDIVLQAVADEASKLSAQDGVVGRYGGEEFVIVLAGITAERGEALACSLVESVRRRRLDGLNLEKAITCTIGVVTCTVDGPVSAETLYDVADQHMYAAKRSGKNQAACAVIRSIKELEERERAGRLDERAGHEDFGLTVEQADRPDTQALERVARLLNSRQIDRVSDARKQPRHVWVRQCVVRYVRNHLLHVGNDHGVVRNVSSGGLGLIMPRPRVRGDLLEIMVDRRNERMYLAGQVAYCHRITGVIHDVGLQLVQHAQEPIFSDDPREAVERFEWVRDALADRHVFAKLRESA